MKISLSKKVLQKQSKFNGLSLLLLLKLLNQIIEAVIDTLENE